jgi:hypothetical protein
VVVRLCEGVDGVVGVTEELEFRTADDAGAAARARPGRRAQLAP